MRVLVTAASKHGTTSEIATAIAEGLRPAGLTVEVHPPEAITSLDTYDAVVLGSGVYAGRWLEPARSFVDRHEAALRARPTWLFSSGPIGDPPKPEGDPAEIPPLVERLAPRGHRMFAGRLERANLGFMERTITRALKAPDGDFRDWAAIRAWAESIARDLAPTAVAT